MAASALVCVSSGPRVSEASLLNREKATRSTSITSPLLIRPSRPRRRTRLPVGFKSGYELGALWVPPPARPHSSAALVALEPARRSVNT
jgi:hypothetical protein